MNDMDLMLKMAQAQTLLDVVELLLYLRSESSSVHHQRIDEMLGRLAIMAKTMT